MNNDIPIFRPWLKVIFILLLVMEMANVIFTGHVSFVRIRKEIPNAQQAGISNGRIILDGGMSELKVSMLKYFPGNDAMRSALKKGVAINRDGTITGVLAIECPGLFNPLAKKEIYVNIVALAIVTDPNCLNTNAIAVDDPLIPLLKQMPDTSLLSTMKSTGWRIGNTAWLDAATTAISQMPVSKDIFLISKDTQAQ